MLSRWRLAPSCQIYALSKGILVCSERSVRINFGSSAFEASLVGLIRGRRDFGPLYDAYTASTVDGAVSTLRSLGAIEPCDSPIQIVDLWAEPGEPVVSVDAKLIVIAHPDDPRLEALLAAVQGHSTLLVWIDGDRVVAVHNKIGQSPCVRCALLFDTDAYGRAQPAALLGPVFEALRLGKFASFEGSTGLQVAQALAASMQVAESAWPVPGQALVVNARTWQTRHDAYHAHPACPCAGYRNAARLAVAADFGVQPALSQFAPLLRLAPTDADQPSRVMFRRSQSPWPNRASDYGAATARGELAEVRALAEGIERFAMHHAPADEMNLSAVQLGSRAMSESKIRSLLFRDQTYQSEGFRLPRYELDSRRDWSWAEHIVTGERLLIPTSLVGRTRPGDCRLVDATSNGYAAHRSRPSAIINAIFELVERDALLMTWYLNRTPPRFDVSSISEISALKIEVAGFLVGDTIGFPVVWLLARLPDGSIRSACGAASCFDVALRRATLELVASTAKSQSLGPALDRALDLEDPGLRPGPSDHLRYYMDPEHCEPIYRRMRVPCTESLQSCRARWPGSSVEVSIERVVTVLTGAGLGDIWVVDRSLPHLFGASWHAVRAVIPGIVELSWGQPLRRLASPRLHRPSEGFSRCPHPIS